MWMLGFSINQAIIKEYKHKIIEEWPKIIVHEALEGIRALQNLNGITKTHNGLYQGKK